MWNAEWRIGKRRISRGVILGLALVVLVIVAYLPAMQGGFVWDDDDYVTKNPLLTADDGLSRIWFSLDSPSQYFPLVYTTFRIEHAIWGLNPAGYHIVNVILHIINALLVWLVLRRLRIPGAWLAAAIWALHPVNVESVAWITERKNTLSTVFYLTSLLAWVRFADESEKRPWRFYALSLVLFQLALFAKTTACTLPAALLLVLWIREKRIDWRRIAQIAPYVVLGIAMGLVSIWWEQHHQGTKGAEFAFSPIERILIASRALWFYVGKLVWPSRLAFSYARWQIDPADPVQYVWPAACILAVAVLWWKRKVIGRGPIAAVVFFLAALVPMLGVFSLYTFRYTFVADHYQYVASIGLIGLIGYVGASAGKRWRTPFMRYAVPVIVLAALGILTWRQGHAYKDAETLWRHTIAANPTCALAHNNLANILDRKGRLDEAIEHYYRAIDLNPKLAEVHLNLAIALTTRERYDEAASECHKTIELSPRFPDAHYRLGLALARQGRNAEAVQSYVEAIRLKPDYAEAYNGMGVAFVAERKLDEAVEYINRALEIKPHYADAHNNMAAALYFRGMYADSWRHIQLCEEQGGHPHPGLIKALSDKMPR
jgi:Flp pilus assembly protein TadD